MLHFDGGRPRADGDGMGNQVGFPVTLDGDDISKLLKLAWVVASGGDEVSASTVDGAEVTSCTAPMSVPGSR